MKKDPLILFFDEITEAHYKLVGGKAASLGRSSQKLKSKGILVPPGFVITSEVFNRFIKLTDIGSKIRKIVKSIKPSNITDLKQKSEAIKGLFMSADFPEELSRPILDAYNQFGKGKLVAVRSSATTEDMRDASFAGQFDTFLCISSPGELIRRIKDCLAGLYNARAISYRKGKKIKEEDVLLGIVVQEMVRSDLGASGVMFSLDTETGFREVVYITASYGFGELIVQGEINPDQFYVFKPTLNQGFKPIIESKVGEKAKELTFHNNKVIKIKTDLDKQRKFSITEENALELARMCMIIEDEYGTPVDVEWAIDERDTYILQIRPETVHSQRISSVLMEVYELQEDGPIICKGEPVGAKIGNGKAQVILDASDIDQFEPGGILVTEMTNPDWEPIMKMASAIITVKGGRTCHAAIVSREQGIPCIIACSRATSIINTGNEITVNCSTGEGLVHKGLLKFVVNKLPSNLPNTRTKIMMNVGIPEKAFVLRAIPNDGVGLAREEFIINSHVGIHPLALIHFSELKQDKKMSPEETAIIEKATQLYTDPTKYFIDKLAQGIGKIGAAFWPNDVIVRLSDFKTNEYAGLTGGKLFEPSESNPMIGWRGASRYYDPKYKPAFGLECEAIKKVRNVFGLTNIKVMIPFCRTPEEGRKVIGTMFEFGLKQHENGLEVYVMCEIPSNVIQAEEFCDIFDGFSIGSNDLTQLTLGLDRDSELVAHIYDERNNSVKWLINHVIQVAKKHNKKIGICGQAPSDFPEFAQFLVECGIDSISLNPDTVIKTRLLIAEKEKSLGIG